MRSIPLLNEAEPYNRMLCVSCATLTIVAHVDKMAQHNAWRESQLFAAVASAQYSQFLETKNLPVE